jgi:nucleoside-diphosphate-sugar epimerase
MPMKALVTGAAGFVGHHVSEELKRRGYIVDRRDIINGSDAHIVFASKLASRYDLVVHAAASAPHRAAIDGQGEHFARNVHLDSAMFDWAVRTGQGRVLYLSSSAAYPISLQSGQGLPTHLHEDDIALDDAQEPDANYGWTKLTGERLAAAARAKGLPVTVVRPFSGYGTDQTDNFPFRAILTGSAAATTRSSFGVTARRFATGSTSTTLSPACSRWLSRAPRSRSTCAPASARR